VAKQENLGPGGMFLYKAWYKIKVFLLDAILRPDRPSDMVRLGSYYGGWWLPSVSPSAGIAVCVGAGLDVTFDVELRRLGYTVYTLDPTPESVKYVRETSPELELVPVGIWTSDGTVQFLRDRADSESWSVEGGYRPYASDEAAAFPVMTIRSFMESVAAAHIGLLKLDIEGAEHLVLRSMLDDGVTPTVLCVEFDDSRIRTIVTTVRRLRRSGYVLLQMENFNFMFAR
jgi:FkbM family methyltransferase